MTPSTPQPVLLAWSGGKDSALALAALQAGPDHEVAALLTTFSGKPGKPRCTACPPP
jgi:diphthamide synthase (EF-2-diphthine--ammonia ligase)